MENSLSIPFNKPFLTNNEIEYIQQAVDNGQISGNGLFTKKCQLFFEQKWGYKKCLLTTSCTDALEMAALLLDIKPNDEIIIPSYSFVSTALAFVRQGAKIVFVDSKINHPGINEDRIEEIITPKTKAIVPVHYAGVACNMDKIMALADRYNLFVVEDAAQAIDSYYKGKPLGGIGHIGCFSFHETKNIQCGEGGMLVINDDRFIERSEIIWEKGTNRAQFFRGEINRYNWVDIGSSFLPSELNAAFLWAQLEYLENIQNKRKEIWNWYDDNVNTWLNQFHFKKPYLPKYASNNAHMYYLICDSHIERTRLIDDLKAKGILAIFHYLCLHDSPYYSKKHEKGTFPKAKLYESCLVRLPFYYELNTKDLLSAS